MKFSIGDKILLKRTGEEGTVSGFIGKDMLEVEVSGTHFPVYADEVDHPYLKWFTEKKKPKKTTAPEQLPVEKEKDRPKRLPRGIYLSFMPVYRAEELEDIVDQLKVYLINETATPVRFSYEVSILNRSAFSHEGSLHAFGNLYLHSVDYGDMSDQPRFSWRLADAIHEAFKTEEGILKIKPSKVFGHISNLLQKNEATFSYLLVEDFVEKPKEQKRAQFIPQTAATQPKPAKITSFTELPRYEVDLHIEQLIPDHKKLSNTEIMDIQLTALERYLYLAIMHRQERMIIIHGLGTGALKDAVHRLLKQMPDVKSYRNEWLGNYGFGATEVIFKY